MARAGVGDHQGGKTLSQGEALNGMWRDQCRQFGGTVKGAGSIGVQILSAVSIQMSLILPPTVCWIRHGGLGQMMIVVPFVSYMTFT